MTHYWICAVYTRLKRKHCLTNRSGGGEQRERKENENSTGQSRAVPSKMETTSSELNEPNDDESDGGGRRGEST